MYSQLDEEEDDDLEFRQPNYFTRLLLGEDDEVCKCLHVCY